MRVVLDTDVITAGFRSDRGASRRLLLAAFDRQLTIIVSVPLMVEYEAVLKRPEQLAAVGLSAREIDAVLDALVYVAEPIRLPFLWRPRLKDPNDEMVLETAINGRADWLVTFNVRHFTEAVDEFGIRLALPSEIWRQLQELKNEKK